MKVSLLLVPLIFTVAAHASHEHSPKSPKSGKDGVIGDAIEHGARRAGTVIANGVDSALKAAKRVEKDSQCPKRKVKKGISNSEDVARVLTLRDLKKGQEVDFDDGSTWHIESNNYIQERKRVFEMRTVIYNNSASVYGFPLWRNRIRERHREGYTRAGNKCDGTKTTFKRLDREFTTAGYVAVAGIGLVALRLLYKIVS